MDSTLIAGAGHRTKTVKCSYKSLSGENNFIIEGHFPIKLFVYKHLSLLIVAINSFFLQRKHLQHGYII